MEKVNRGAVTQDFTFTLELYKAAVVVVIFGDIKLLIDVDDANLATQFQKRGIEKLSTNVGADQGTQIKICELVVLEAQLATPVVVRIVSHEAIVLIA